MKAWLYKARESVEAGDIILFYYRKTTPPAGVRFIGAFRVRDPGAARLNDDCDLAILDGDLADRVRAAYGTPVGEPITAWLIEPAVEVAAPSLEEPAVAEFLSRRATLVEYLGPLGRRAAREPSIETPAAWPARSLFAPEGAITRISVDCERARFVREEEPSGQITWSSPPSTRPRATFLPSREVLAMFPGFVKLYEDREISFDETYYDLCKDLNQVELREAPLSLADELSTLERTLGGSVRLDANRFVVDTVHGPIAASMVAEGHRKLACPQKIWGPSPRRGVRPMGVNQRQQPTGLGNRAGACAGLSGEEGR